MNANADTLKTANQDIRQSPNLATLYFDTKSQRNDAKRMEREAVLNETSLQLALPLWQALESQCDTILAEHSKDIEVCCWLIEARVRTDGITGLITAWQYTTDLLRTVGLACQPNNPLDYLAKLHEGGNTNSLSGYLRFLPITDNTAISANFQAWQYEAKNNDAQLAHALTAAIQSSPLSFYQQQLQFIATAKTTFTTLCEVAHALDNKQAPSKTHFLDALNQLELIFSDIVQQHFPQTRAEIKTQTSPRLASSTNSPSTTSALTRETALQQIETLSHFFEQTEPHSPLIFLLKRCVEWGKLPLPKLLEQMITDDTTRDKLCNLIGIKL